MLTPAACAFCVFAKTSTGCYYVGHAACPTASRCSAYYAGQKSEDTLTAELLAIYWALVWIADSADSGYRYQVRWILGSVLWALFGIWYTVDI